MTWSKFAVGLAAVFAIAMAPAAERLPDTADNGTLANTVTHDTAVPVTIPACKCKKKVALSLPDAPGDFPALDQIVKDVTRKLQNRIEDDFERFLEKQMSRQTGKNP
jgi:hypothetical protein